MSEKCVIKVTTQPTFQKGTAVRKALTLAEALLDRAKLPGANNVEYFQLDGVTPFEFPGPKKEKKVVAPKPKPEPKGLKVVGPVTEVEEKEKKNAKGRSQRVTERGNDGCR